MSNIKLGTISKKIQSQAELETIVNEETTKLGLDPSKINANLFGGFNGLSGVRRNGEKYDLFLNNDFASTRSTVRHELYHILKGDCDKKFNWAYYLFIAEPRATLYGSLKLKL